MKSRNCPTFIGIGGHKCATTWLSECLRDHPDVFMTDPKETKFFLKNWDKGIDWYIAHFSGSRKYKARGEFTSHYIYFETVPERIYNLFGPIPIVAVIRDPIERALSELKHGNRLGRVEKPKYNLVDKKMLTQAIESYPHIIRYSYYSKGLERFSDIMGGRQLLVFLQEDFRVAPENCLRRLWEFLGVSADFIPSRADHNVSKGIIPKYYFLEKLRKKAFQKMRNIRGVVPFVRKTGLPDLYRRLNAETDLRLTSEAQKVLWENLKDDWRSAKQYCWRPNPDTR